VAAAATGIVCAAANCATMAFSCCSSASRTAADAFKAAISAAAPPAGDRAGDAACRRATGAVERDCGCGDGRTGPTGAARAAGGADTLVAASLRWPAPSDRHESGLYVCRVAFVALVADVAAVAWVRTEAADGDGGTCTRREAGTPVATAPLPARGWKADARVATVVRVTAVVRVCRDATDAASSLTPRRREAGDAEATEGEGRTGARPRGCVGVVCCGLPPARAARTGAGDSALSPSGLRGLPRPF